VKKCLANLRIGSKYSDSIAYSIAKKIGEEGTAIYRGDKPGIDYVGGLEKFRPGLVFLLARNQAMNLKSFIGKEFASVNAVK